LRRRFAANDGWTVETGSILDPDYVEGLGRFDVVYSWGVLHHTGRLWDALAAAAGLVAPGGRLFVSIYNDQGLASDIWRRLKRRYLRSGRVGRLALLTHSGLFLARRRPLLAVVNAAWPGRRRGPGPRTRGMDRRHNLVDWVGGYPFEVARPEEVFRFVAARGFELRHLTTCGGGLGCNEYIFERVAVPAPAE
jgi:2-polyprenyl-6-hydroxyphenyl methylase/3-demethylubiquinone-9 3-methyltransferase